MMPRTLITVLAIAALAGILGPGLDDYSAERDQAAEIEAAQQQAAHQARYDAAVRSLCGDNAGWMELQDGAIQCTTKRGTPTQRVTLTAKVTP